MSDGDDPHAAREPDAASPSTSRDAAQTADVHPIDDPAPSVLLAPLAGLFRPELAARRYLAARTLLFWISFLLYVSAIPATLVAQIIRASMVDYRWHPTPITTAPATAPTEWRGVLTSATAGEVWSSMGHDQTVHPLILFAGGIAALVVALAAFVAWLFLPAVHQTGLVRRSYERSFRAVASGVGLLWGLVLILGSYLVFMDNCMDRMSSNKQLADPAVLMALFAVSLPATVWLLLYWIGHACRVARGTEQSVVIPPTCEGCGYDLTHRPADGLCPECGISVDSSLTPGFRRPGVEWEKDADAGVAWLRVSHAVLLHPSRFYAALQVRTNSQAASTFARWHYVALGSAAWVWMMVLMGLLNAMSRGGCFLPFMIMLLAPLCGWLVQRIVGAIAASWWVTRGTLPDVRWAAKIIGYETAYLWTYGLYNATFLTAMVLTSGKFFRAWTNPILERALLGMPLEMAAVVYPNALLSLLWLWRYRIAAKAVRWSNF